MKSHEQAPSLSTPEDILPEILASSAVRTHHVNMFRQGTTYKRESAYATYIAPTGDISTSKLLIARPIELVSTHSEAGARKVHTSINVEPLVCTPRTSNNVQAQEEFVETASDQNYHTLTESGRVSVANIKESYDYDEDEKDYLIQKVLEREFSIAYNLPNQGKMRQDIAFMAHNHPVSLHGTLTYATKDLIIPSGQDVITHQEVAVKNPGYISAVVSTDTSTRGILLYGNEANKTQAPEAYAANSHANNGSKRQLAALATHGFSYVILPLDEHGAIREKDSDELIDFARNIAR